MPNYKEHCEHTLSKYGVSGEDIHTWMDEPVRFCGQSHRQFRHNSNTVKEVGRIFGSRYGRELAENIAIDHIMLDMKQSIQSNKETYNWDEIEAEEDLKHSIKSYDTATNFLVLIIFPIFFIAFIIALFFK